MQHPDWYPAWREEAVRQLRRKNQRLNARFRLNDWPRYHYDTVAGTLVFSDAGVPKVIAEVQVAGATSARAGNWLWSWANAQWPQERTLDAEAARRFGEEHGIQELTSGSVADPDLNGLGWDLTAAAARIADAPGAYRPPDDDGALFLIYRSIAWAG